MEQADEESEGKHSEYRIFAFEEPGNEDRIVEIVQTHEDAKDSECHRH